MLFINGSPLAPRLRLLCSGLQVLCNGQLAELESCTHNGKPAHSRPSRRSLAWSEYGDQTLELRLLKRC